MLAREYPNASEIPRRATSNPHGTQGEGKGLAMSEREEEMSKDEMQRFLNQQADGKTETEAYRNLMDILGITFPEIQTEQQA